MEGTPKYLCWSYFTKKGPSIRTTYQIPALRKMSRSVAGTATTSHALRTDTNRNATKGGPNLNDDDIVYAPLPTPRQAIDLGLVRASLSSFNTSHDGEQNGRLVGRSIGESVSAGCWSTAEVPIRQK